MKIVIATFNKGKLKEFKALFDKSNFEVLSLKDFTTEDIDETGRSYEENAMLKAQKANELSNYPSLGDDSGLQVKLLRIIHKSNGIKESKIYSLYNANHIFEERLKTFIANKTIKKEKSLIKLNNKKILFFYYLIKYLKIIHNIKL